MTKKAKKKLTKEEKLALDFKTKYTSTAISMEKRDRLRGRILKAKFDAKQEKAKEAVSRELTREYNKMMKPILPTEMFNLMVQYQKGELNKETKSYLKVGSHVYVKNLPKEIHYSYNSTCQYKFKGGLCKPNSWSSSVSDIDFNVVTKKTQDALFEFHSLNNERDEMDRKLKSILNSYKTSRNLYMDFPEWADLMLDMDILKVKQPPKPKTVKTSSCTALVSMEQLAEIKKLLKGVLLIEVTEKSEESK